MKLTSFEDTGKEDEFVNGYSGGTKNDPIVFEDEDDDYYIIGDEVEDSEEYYPGEGPNKQKKSSDLDLPDDEPDDYELLTPEERRKYNDLTDTHPWKLYKILGKSWPDIIKKRIEEAKEEEDKNRELGRPNDYDLLAPDEQDEYNTSSGRHSDTLIKILGDNYVNILDKRAEEAIKKREENKQMKEKILEHKEILTDPTYKGSKARTKVRKIYTEGMQGSDKKDEDALLNETSFKKYILGQNITDIPIDSLLSKDKQFAPADFTDKTKGGKVKSLIELKTVNYKPLSEGHPKPTYWCPINKLANLYGYPEGIKNEPDNWDRIKQVKSYKNVPSKTERKLYWTVLNRDEGEKMEDFIFPEEIKGKPNKAKNNFRNRISYVDLNDKQLKKDIMTYVKDKNKAQNTNKYGEYTGADEYEKDEKGKDKLDKNGKPIKIKKPYKIEISPVEGNKQMSILFSNPKKLTDKKVHKTKHEYDMENINFIND